MYVGCFFPSISVIIYSRVAHDSRPIFLLNLLKKTSFVSDGKVVIGYELNGNNLEGAFRKAEATIKAHIDTSFRLIEQLQSEIKKEKLRSNTNNSEEL